MVRNPALLSSGEILLAFSLTMSLTACSITTGQAPLPQSASEVVESSAPRGGAEELSWSEVKAIDGAISLIKLQFTDGRTTIGIDPQLIERLPPLLASSCTNGDLRRMEVDEFTEWRISRVGVLSSKELLGPHDIERHLGVWSLRGGAVYEIYVVVRGSDQAPAIRGLEWGGGS